MSKFSDFFSKKKQPDLTKVTPSELGFTLGALRKEGNQALGQVEAASFYTGVVGLSAALVAAVAAPATVGVVLAPAIGIAAITLGIAISKVGAKVFVEPIEEKMYRAEAWTNAAKEGRVGWYDKITGDRPPKKEYKI